MIVISSGMQKSGSAWFFNLTNDLLAAAGHDDVRTIREQYHLKDILMWSNCNIRAITLSKLMRILLPHFLHHTFVVKTHGGPASMTRAIYPLMRIGHVKATYIYRDPRAVSLSAFEHGQRIREEGEHHTFAKLDSIESAIVFAKERLSVWEDWQRFGRVLMCRYEDLVTNPIKEIHRLAAYLSVDVSSDRIEEVISTYSPDAVKASNSMKSSLHFSKGVPQRFRDVMRREELDMCDAVFGDYLVKMGYSK